ncbi:hypothetical protein [Nitrosospira sp. NRS527]|uniref:hypothetical protein n=1 Tax=Nitrosospira sp. NRS527 TaxID=155925 RepID=UPI001BCEEB39|nr:hypothetical protein [Nitrosospira sp. NRS527]
MQERFKISVQRSCHLALLQRSVWYAKSMALDQSALCQRIRDIAMNRPRFGYLRVLVMLKREGWQVGKKLVYLANQSGDTGFGYTYLSTLAVERVNPASCKVLAAASAFSSHRSTSRTCLPALTLLAIASPIEPAPIKTFTFPMQILLFMICQ